MSVGVYTGGTPNLNAIGLALKAPEHIIVLVNTSDMIVCIPWFFFIRPLRNGPWDCSFRHSKRMTVLNPLTYRERMLKKTRRLISMITAGFFPVPYWCRS